jgi:hypothetical protein
VNYSVLTLHYFETAVGEAAGGVGILAGPDVFRGAAGDRRHGTWVQFDVHVSAGIIRAARFLAFACPHTIAVSAWIAEQAAGTVARPCLPESVQDLSDRFAVPVAKRGRLLIVEDAWVAALATPALAPPH